MKALRSSTLSAAALGLLLAAPCGCRRGAGEPASRGVEAPPAPPQRIVSFAPSITETLFALGLGDRVVGVTRFCRYPPEAARRAPVGGYEDISYEAVARLRPDLVVLLDAHARARSPLERLGIPVLEVRHERYEDILDSYRRIGERCGAAEAAARLTAATTAAVARVAQRVRGRPRPSVMLAIGGAAAPDQRGSVFIAGRGGFFDRVLELAGGRNAYQGPLIFPSVSTEGVLAMAPDVIIHLDSEAPEAAGGEGAGARWRRFPSIPAVRDGRIYTLAGQHVMIPGPRMVLTLEGVARLLHPGAGWDAAEASPAPGGDGP
jgi:iron complex transport system substrate-binding protein